MLSLDNVLAFSLNVREHESVNREVWDEGITADEWCGGASPPAVRQTWPPADRASSLSPHYFAQCASLSPAPADGAPHETTPADSETEDASGHANITGAEMAAGYDK